jgi:hypothetical protein
MSDYKEWLKTLKPGMLVGVEDDARGSAVGKINSIQRGLVSVSTGNGNLCFKETKGTEWKGHKVQIVPLEDRHRDTKKRAERIKQITRDLPTLSDSALDNIATIIRYEKDVQP